MTLSEGYKMLLKANYRGITFVFQDMKSLTHGGGAAGLYKITQGTFRLWVQPFYKNFLNN